MIAKALENLKDEAKSHMKETQELNLIFASIINKCKKKY
jgi:predicted small metal-binding protein